MSSPVPSPLPLLRAARRVAQADLAAACQISAAKLSNVECGRREADPEVLTRAAVALDCPVEVVAGGDFVVTSNAGRIEVKALKP